MLLQTKHLITGNELSAIELAGLIEFAIALKRDKLAYIDKFTGKHLALFFDKQSLRTRTSFTVAMHQLGGHVIESITDIRKPEEPEDQIRVIQGYCDAVMLRVSDDSILTRMQQHASIPIINGLTDLYHPCQILADLMALQEKFEDLNGLNICYIGDGNNILHSLLIMATKLGVNVHYCCPKGLEPQQQVLDLVAENHSSGEVNVFTNPQAAVENCSAIYTDVWTSMGFAAKDESLFAGMQVNEELVAKAKSDCVVMHCMPMIRGKEISATLADQECSVIFQQSENRLHAQKAILLSLIK